MSCVGQEPSTTDNACMAEVFERAASAAVQWFRRQTGPSAAAALIGVAVARHPTWVLIPATVLASWALADFTANRSCYKGACARCGHTVCCALILEGTSEWVAHRLARLDVPKADVARLLRSRPGGPAARVSKAVFVCPWCTCLRLWFHPESARLGGRLPVLRQPEHSTSRLAGCAVRLRAPRRQFIGIPAGRPPHGYVGIEVDRAG
jgi:hypothetical protein